MFYVYKISNYLSGRRHHVKMIQGRYQRVILNRNNKTPAAKGHLDVAKQIWENVLWINDTKVRLPGKDLWLPGEKNDNLVLWCRFATSGRDVFSHWGSSEFKLLSRNSLTNLNPVWISLKSVKFSLSRSHNAEILS